MLLASLDLPYELAEEGNPRNAPKGKLPYLLDEGETVADSELMAIYLDEYTGGRVYGGMSDEQRAQGVALSRLAEDHLYWLMVASRWLDDEWWPNVVQGFFGNLPGIIRPVISGVARRQVRQTYDLHGLGRHSLEEQYGFARRDLQALEVAVPAEGFLAGSSPAIFDFTVAGMMAGIYDNQPKTWVTELALPQSRLRAYTERVQEAVGVWGRR
jgi:glutathione S-transferase